MASGVTESQLPMGRSAFIRKMIPQMREGLGWIDLRLVGNGKPIPKVGLGCLVGTSFSLVLCKCQPIHVFRSGDSVADATLELWGAVQ